MTDPFAGDPWATDLATEDDPWPTEEPGLYDAAPSFDEAQAGVPQTDITPAVTTTTTTKERVIISNNEGKIVITLKFGEGFSAPWVVFHVDNPAEGAHLLSDPMTQQLLKLTAATAKAVKSLDSGSDPRRSGGNSAGGQRQGGPSTPPGVEGKRCKHGDMVYKTGNSAKGPWKAWFCPAPKEDPSQCKPIWLR